MRASLIVLSASLLLMFSGCEDNHEVRVEGIAKNSNSRRIVVTDNGEIYHIDDKSKFGWTPAALGKRVSVRGTLVVDDRFRAESHSIVTGGKDRVLEPPVIWEILEPSDP